MVENVLALRKRHRIAVAWAHDFNTIRAVCKASDDGFAEAILIGNKSQIKEICIIQASVPACSVSLIPIMKLPHRRSCKACEIR